MILWLFKKNSKKKSLFLIGFNYSYSCLILFNTFSNFILLFPNPSEPSGDSCHSAHRETRRSDGKFKASLGYRVSSWLSTRKIPKTPLVPSILSSRCWATTETCLDAPRLLHPAEGEEGKATQAPATRGERSALARSFFTEAVLNSR